MLSFVKLLQSLAEQPFPRLLGRHMYIQSVFKFSESKQEPNRQYFQLLRLVHKTVKSMRYIRTFLLIPEDVCLFR